MMITNTGWFQTCLITTEKKGKMILTDVAGIDQWCWSSSIMIVFEVTNLVIEHSHGIDGPFIDGLPIRNGDSNIIWLMLWNIFPYIGNNHPNWLSYFQKGLKPPIRSISSYDLTSNEKNTLLMDLWQARHVKSCKNGKQYLPCTATSHGGFTINPGWTVKESSKFAQMISKACQDCMSLMNSV